MLTFPFESEVGNEGTGELLSVAAIVEKREGKNGSVLAV